jgi:hypothetical protein
VAQGESIPVNNPPAPIQTEAKAKDVRFLLEALHGQVEVIDFNKFILGG